MFQTIILAFTLSVFITPAYSQENQQELDPAFAYKYQEKFPSYRFSGQISCLHDRLRVNGKEFGFSFPVEIDPSEQGRFTVPAGAKVRVTHPGEVIARSIEFHSFEVDGELSENISIVLSVPRGVSVEERLTSSPFYYTDLRTSQSVGEFQSIMITYDLKNTTEFMGNPSEHDAGYGFITTKATAFRRLGEMHCTVSDSTDATLF